MIRPMKETEMLHVMAI